MLTFIAVLVVLFALVAVVGGVAMMFDAKGCFFSWWMGYNAMKSGFEILACVLPAILEAISDSNR